MRSSVPVGGARRARANRRRGVLLWLLLMPLQAWAAPEHLAVGIPPYFEPARLVALYKPLLDYLEAELGVPARIYTRADNRDWLQAAAQYQFDLVVATPLLARHLQHRDWRVVAAKREHDAYLVILRRDDRPRRLAEAGTVRVAVHDPLSMEAVVVRQWGERALPGVRVDTVNSQTLRNCFVDLIGGRADLVFMPARGLTLAGPDLRPQLQTEISGFQTTYLNVLAVSPRLPEDLRERLVTAIQGLPQSGIKHLLKLDQAGIPFDLEPDISEWDEPLRQLGLGPSLDSP